MTFAQTCEGLLILTGYVCDIHEGKCVDLILLFNRVEKKIDNGPSNTSFVLFYFLSGENL